VQNLSYENEFDFHENKPVGGTHFHMNGFARRLVLTQRHKVTRKWPILLMHVFDQNRSLHSCHYFAIIANARAELGMLKGIYMYLKFSLCNLCNTNRSFEQNGYREACRNYTIPRT